MTTRIDSTIPHSKKTVDSGNPKIAPDGRPHGGLGRDPDNVPRAARPDELSRGTATSQVRK